MKLNIPTKQLSAISLLSAVGAVSRIGLGWIAFSVPYVPLPLGFSFYGILVKIGLTETLAFVSGFAFGPVQGFLTGALIIIISDILSVYGPGLWTPFIAAIIGMIGVLGVVFHRFNENPSTIFWIVSAVTLTIMSELLQNVWFAWYMWSFYMPETPFPIVLVMTFIKGVASFITALVNNFVFFTAVAPRVIKFLREMVTLEA